MSVTSLDKIHAYRHLYRSLLHAVQYSKPARYTARDQLRNAFRKEDPANFSKEKVERTVEFLNIAAREKGLEHHLVKTLILTAYWRRRNLARPPVQIRTDVQFELSRSSRTHYDMTLAMLNDTMGLCLRGGSALGLGIVHNARSTADDVAFTSGTGWYCGNMVLSWHRRGTFQVKLWEGYTSQELIGDGEDASYDEGCVWRGLLQK